MPRILCAWLFLIWCVFLVSCAGASHIRGGAMVTLSIKADRILPAADQEIPVFSSVCWFNAMQGCGVTFRLNERVPPPHRIAVLPLSGEAGEIAARDRALIRAMLRRSLLVRNVSVVENAYADRVLSESGWMTDPDRFDPSRVPTVEACRALGVDGIIVGTAFEAADRDYLLYFRRGLPGRLRWWSGEGRLYGEADHCATRYGGVLTGSDQIITAIAEHVENGTSLAFVKIVEEYLDEVLATLPEFDPEEVPLPVPPEITGIEVKRNGEAAAIRCYHPEPANRMWQIRALQEFVEARAG